MLSHHLQSHQAGVSLYSCQTCAQLLCAEVPVCVYIHAYITTCVCTCVFVHAPMLVLPAGWCKAHFGTSHTSREAPPCWSRQHWQKSQGEIIPSLDVKRPAHREETSGPMWQTVLWAVTACWHWGCAGGLCPGTRALPQEAALGSSAAVIQAVVACWPCTTFLSEDRSTYSHPPAA